MKTAEGKMLQARMKGVFKKDEDITSTNPVAVGDSVEIEMEENSADGNAMITDIHPRKNYIVRLSPHGRHKKHIIAANMDQAVLICTLKQPKTSQGFIDRFLVTAAAYHIPVVLVFNKKDLYKAKEMAHYEYWESLYTDIGYKVMLVSADTKEGVNEFIDCLANKTTLVSGHSGVGKSSLINLVLPGAELRTKAVSDWSGKGLHTTTFAEMFDIPGGGSIIDTPGIRELGIVDIEKSELSHYFLEMQPYLQQCQFNNCLHVNEPGCAVKEAVREGLIDEDRYVSYVTLLESIGAKDYRV